MADKLDVLERDLRVTIEASGLAAHETTMHRWPSDGRLDIERLWDGKRRWIYVTASDDDAGLDAKYGDYSLFMGWYSDPPGEVFWEGRRLATLAQAHEVIDLWVIKGVAPEAMPRWP